MYFAKIKHKDDDNIKPESDHTVADAETGSVLSFDPEDPEMCECHMLIKSIKGYVEEGLKDPVLGPQLFNAIEPLLREYEVRMRARAEEREDDTEKSDTEKSHIE